MTWCMVIGRRMHEFWTDEVETFDTSSINIYRSGDRMMKLKTNLEWP